MATTTTDKQLTDNLMHLVRQFINLRSADSMVSLAQVREVAERAGLPLTENDLPFFE